MPSSVTIQLKRIPTCLRGEIAQSENKSATLAGLLEEFALRYSAPQDELAHKSSQIHDLNDQVRALRLDLEGGQREIENYKIANAELSRRVKVAEESLAQVEQELNDKQRHLEMKTRLFKVQKKEARKALNHAISLVNYLGRVEPQ